MSCCGNERATLRQEYGMSARTESEYWTSRPVEFEYFGHNQLTVTGPLTGTVYHFAANGARVRVHGSDAPSLLSAPGIKPVSYSQF